MRQKFGLFGGIALIGSGAGGASGTPFTLDEIAIVPYGTIEPSAGSFVTQYPGFENYFLLADVVVDNSTSSFWDPADMRDYVDCTTYLAIDPQGPSDFQGLAGSFPAPKWNDYIASSPGLVVSGPGLASKYDGGFAGIRWSADVAASFQAPSEPTDFGGGHVLDSLFIGHFVVDTPGATLTGLDLYTVIDGVPGYLPLDGGYIVSKASGDAFQLGFLRYPAGDCAPPGSEVIDVFVQQSPSPGAMGLAACAGGLVVVRRRRRSG